MKLTVIDRANKYAEIASRYYRQHDPRAKATKVAFEEYKRGYISGWRAAKKCRTAATAEAVQEPWDPKIHGTGPLSGDY
jgi:hypothetical protein